MLRAALLLTSALAATGCAGSLLFPENSVFQFTIGISVPVIKTERGGITFAVAYQFNYNLPYNVSQLEPTVILAREVRDVKLRDTYATIEDLLSENGWGNGKECLLRSVCEFAETPLSRSDRDLVEEIVHLFLTPSEDLPEAVNSSHRSVNKSYQEAERLGRSGGDCIVAYPDCIASPLESFTEIVFP